MKLFKFGDKYYISILQLGDQEYYVEVYDHKPLLKATDKPLAHSMGKTIAFAVYQCIIGLSIEIKD